MILAPIPLQRPAAAVVRALRTTAPSARQTHSGISGARPVLQPVRAPQQLCLDLQPRPR